MFGSLLLFSAFLFSNELGKDHHSGILLYSTHFDSFGVWLNQLCHMATLVSGPAADILRPFGTGSGVTEASNGVDFISLSFPSYQFNFECLTGN